MSKNKSKITTRIIKSAKKINSEVLEFGFDFDEPKLNDNYTFVAKLSKENFTEKDIIKIVKNISKDFKYIFLGASIEPATSEDALRDKSQTEILSLRIGFAP